MNDPLFISWPIASSGLLFKDGRGDREMKKADCCENVLENVRKVTRPQTAVGQSSGLMGGGGAFGTG